MASERRIDLDISEDKQSVRIAISEDGVCLGDMTLPPEGVTAIISVLISLRSMMPVEKPTPIDLEDSVTTAIDPVWYTRPEPMSEGSLFVVKHPVTGSLGFLFPRQEVQNIVRLLSTHLGIHPALRSGSKPN